MKMRKLTLIPLISLFILPIIIGASVVEFGGTFQVCDPASVCTKQCLSPNMWTGGCGCPDGYTSSCFHTYADGYSTNICVCEGDEAKQGGYYGGAYQINDADSMCEKNCVVPNKFQGSCECPHGYTKAWMRVSTDLGCLHTSSANVTGSHIVICTKPNLKSGAGNYKGVYQIDQHNNCINPNPLTGGCECPENACASWAGSASVVEGSKTRVYGCSSSMQIAPDPSTIQGKTVFGYQGWFSTNTDPAGWRHWSNGGTLSGNNSNIDVWPDLSEFDADELHPTNLHYSDGKVAGVYNADSPKTILRHFQWMQTYGLDGVLLQRFVNEITNHADPMFIFRNNVTNHIISAAATTGRVWSIEYDVSGADANNIYNILTNDWLYLVNTLKILNSKQYLYQNGKPVVTIWGFGFTGGNAAFTMNASLSVINWFKNAGVYVMGGVPYNWRTSTADSVPNFQKVYQSYDAVMPWAVGRYSDDVSFESNYNNIASLDIPYAQQNKLGYGVIIFPGFSWANMHKDFSIFNQIPRRGGEFLMKQANTYIKHPGVTFIKIAMFDEMDEGTAMFKAASTKQNTPSDGQFLYLGIDGTPMNSDAYLCLAGEITSRNAKI
jgi:hypothetical protein